MGLRERLCLGEHVDNLVGHAIHDQHLVFHFHVQSRNSGICERTGVGRDCALTPFGSVAPTAGLKSLADLAAASRNSTSLCSVSTVLRMCSRCWFVRLSFGSDGFCGTFVPLLNSTAPCALDCASESAVPPSRIASSTIALGALMAWHPSRIRRP